MNWSWYGRTYLAIVAGTSLTGCDCLILPKGCNCMAQNTILAVIVAVLPGWKPLAAWGVISLSAGLREICEALSKIRDELRKDQ